MSLPAINAEEFRPAVKGRADFYSWNLYRWLKKEPLRCEVWRSVWNPLDGFGGAFYPLYIGVMDTDGWFMGMMLTRVTVSHGAFNTAAYGPNFGTSDWRNVTDWFWNEYRRIGVCAIHDGTAHKWLHDGPHDRQCQYCGAKEHLQHRRAIETRWVPA